MLFPGNLIPFCSHRRFNGLTRVCSSSSTFCRLVTAELSSYSWISFWIQLNFTRVWNFAVANSLEFSYACIDKKPLWNPFSGSCCSQVFSELNCTKFNWPRSTQVQFRTALTAVYAGVKNSWNSSIKVGGAVIRKFGPFHSSVIFVVNNFDHNFLQTSLKTPTFNCKSTGGECLHWNHFKLQGGGRWEGGGGKDWLQNTLR